MRLWNGRIELETRGHGQVLDLTAEVERLVAGWGIDCGQGTLFVPGSTAGLTTVEYEPGVVQDLRELLERLAPEKAVYHHDAAWGDGNGHAHLRAALIGPDLGFLVRDGRPVRGRWQQFVLCDFDNRPRRRDVVVQAIGTEHTEP